MHTCIEQGLWSANDLHDVAIHLAKLKEKEIPAVLRDIQATEVPCALTKEKASVRELDGYLRMNFRRCMKWSTQLKAYKDNFKISD